MNVESEAISLLNSHSIHLVTVEIGDADKFWSAPHSSPAALTFPALQPTMVLPLQKLMGIIANGEAFVNLRVQVKSIS